MSPYSLRPLIVALAAALPALAGAQSTNPSPSTPDLQGLEGLLAQPVYGSGRSAGASKHAQDLENAPAAVVVRTAGEIRAQGYRTLGEVLESMPGIHLQNDRAYSVAGVRGISRPGDFSSRLLVLIDGARINDALYEGGPFGLEFPLDIGLIDRVEYVAGPGSALYGTSAVLGVVNVITRSASQLPGLQATAEVGSHWDRKVASTWGGEALGARVLFGVSHEQRAGRDFRFGELASAGNPRGEVNGQDGERAAKTYVRARWTDVTVSGGLSERTKEIPTGSYGALPGAYTPWTDRYAYGNIDLAQRFGADHEVNARLGAEKFEFRSTTTYGPADAVSTGREADDAFSLSGELRYTWLGWAGHRPTVGFEYQRNKRQSIRLENLTPVPETLTDFDVSSSRRALFASDEWRVLPSLLLNLGARADWRTDGHLSTSPRVAAIWTPSAAWTLKYTQGSAFREPNPFERLYAYDTQKPNPALKVETLRAREFVALWRTTEQLTFEASLYRFQVRDLIELGTDETDGLNVFTNRGGITSRGLELTGTYVFTGGGQLRLAWSTQQATDRATGAVVSGSPRQLVKFAWTTPGPVPGVLFGWNGQYVGARLTRDGERLGGYFRTNAHLTWAPAGSPGTLAFGIYNLTNERHADPVGPEMPQQAVPQDGREFRVQLGWKF